MELVIILGRLFLFLKGEIFSSYYDTISMLPQTEAYGGRTVKLYDNIELLDIGYVFTIEGKKIFSQVGAMSSDKQFHTEHEI